MVVERVLGVGEDIEFESSAYSASSEERSGGGRSSVLMVPSIKMSSPSYRSAFTRLRQ